VIVPWRKLRQGGARLSWGIGDTGLSSLTNFLLNIFVARTLGAEQFGAFTLAYVTYGVAVNISRGLSIEPLLVRFSAANMNTWRRAASGSTGTALLVGVATGTCAVGAGIVVGGTTGRAFLALGLMLPGLMLQDCWRYAFFAVRQGHHAFFNDLIWALIEIPVLVLLKVHGNRDVFWFVIAWGAGAAVGAVVATFQARAVPSLIRARSWLVAHRDLGPRYLVENCGSNAVSTVQSYATSALLGIQAVGYIQAANVLMGPFRILTVGIGMITLPEVSAMARRTPGRLLRTCLMLSAGQAALALLWVVVVLVGLPLGLGHLLLGALWSKADPLVLPSALAIIGFCLAAGAATGLHALGAAKRSMRVTLVTSGISLGLAIFGAVVAGVLGTLYFAALASFISAAMIWSQFREALREAGIDSRSSQLSPRRRGRHRRSVPARHQLLRGTQGNHGPAAATVAVSRHAARGSYVRGTRQGLSQAATPGEEM
jgi:O-antigen/teichoic acid export membrane protein